VSFGSQNPLWPLPTPPKAWTSGGSFGAKRPSSKTFTRHHQGVDLYASKGTPVLACEDGIVVADQGWDGPDTRAVLVESKETGVLLLYGAVAPGSYPKNGTKVVQGQQIATIGVYPHGSSMLHIEAWKPGVRPPRPRWEANGSQPSQLYDISEYLERAKQNFTDQAQGGAVKPLVCGGYVTASSDPFLDPLRGDLTYGQPCSYFGDTMVCIPTNTVAWRASLKRELDACVPVYNSYNKLVAAKTAKWDKATSDAYESMQAGFKAYEEWNSVNSLPANAVDALREAAAAVRCATEVFVYYLAKKNPDASAENEDSDSKPNNGGQQTPAAEPGGGGLAIAAAGLGLGAYFLLA
jgi:hypothetical protein